jgi:hypothetical protein
MKPPSTSDVHMPKFTTGDGIAVVAIIVGVTGIAVNYMTHGALMSALENADRGFATSTAFGARFAQTWGPSVSFITETSTLTKKAAASAPDIIGWLV